jgi:nicotinamidase-related amidase
MRNILIVVDMQKDFVTGALASAEAKAMKLLLAVQGLTCTKKRLKWEQLINLKMYG